MTAANQPDAPGAAENGVRLARLDGLRGIAACVVAFAFHARTMYADNLLGLDLRLPWLAWPHVLGWTAVDLFFVLSGYIFAHVYLTRPVLVSRPALAEFGVARFARLYPLHVTLVLVIAAVSLGKGANTLPNMLLNLAMLQAFTNPVAQNFVGPSWSLTVECLCYLLFALAAYDGRRTLLRLTVGAILGGALWFALFGQSGGPWVIDIFPRGLLGFFLGQALWHGRERLAEVRWWLLALVFVIAFAMPTGGASPLLPLCLLAWPAALLLALRMSWLESRPMVWLGDRSYAIYLIHLPLIQAAGWAFGLLPPSPGLVVVGHVALIAATLILSDLALRWLEKPARSAIRGAWARRPLSFSRALG